MNYERMRVPELRSIAKDRELSGYSKLKRLELVSLLRASDKVKRHTQRTKTKSLLKELKKLKKKIRKLEKKSSEASKASTSKASESQARVVSEAFSGSYKKHRINGTVGMNVNSFLSRYKESIVSSIEREVIGKAVSCQVTVWLRFIKDEVEVVDLAFNSRMTPIYEFSNKSKVVNSMTEHIL